MSPVYKHLWLFLITYIDRKMTWMTILTIDMKKDNSNRKS